MKKFLIGIILSFVLIGISSCIRAKAQSGGEVNCVSEITSTGAVHVSDYTGGIDVTYNGPGQCTSGYCGNYPLVSGTNQQYSGMDFAFCTSANPTDSGYDPSACIDLATGSGSMYLYCVEEHSDGTLGRYCCPDVAFGATSNPGTDPTQTITAVCEDSQQQELFDNAISDGGDLDVLYQIIESYGCKITFTPNVTKDGKYGCSINGKDIYCVDDLDFSPVLATESNQGCKNTGEDEDACASCMYVEGTYVEATGRGTPTGAIWTAIGCIDPSPSGLITRLYQIGVGIVGGLLLLIRVPQIVIAFNSNQPEKKQEAQAGIWSVAGGLLLLLFASAILEALGLHVLGLPRGFI